MLLHLLLYFSTWEFGESANQQINRTLSVVLVPESNVTVIGRTESISCHSIGGQVPITYYLFRHRNTGGRISTTEAREVKFNVTIRNVTLLGPYKCKVNDNSTDSSYSSAFNFTLQSQEDASSNAQHIILLSSVVAVFLVFLVVIVLSVVFFKCFRRHQTNIHLRVFPCCTAPAIFKSSSAVSSSSCPVAARAGDQVYEAVRCTESEKTTAPDVSYTTLILNGGIGKIIRKEDSVEYGTAVKRH